VVQKTHKSASDRQQRDLSEPQRRCIATGQVLEKSSLLRFVVSPDGELVHDIRNKLPGRGIWITSRRMDLELARQKGLFARSAKQSVHVADNFVELVEAGLAKTSLDLLGLGRKGGQVTAGFAKVEASLKKGKTAVLLAARDGSADGRQKLKRLAGTIPLVELFNSDELSKALGRDNVVHVSIARGGLAEKFLIECSRLAGLRTLDDEGEGPGRSKND